MTASSSGLNINAKEWKSFQSSNIKTGKIICQFFAMGGCRHGNECPYSHELTQEAPEGVDSSAGFFISGRVANLGNGQPPSSTAEGKPRLDTDAIVTISYDAQRSTEAYCPPAVPVEVPQQFANAVAHTSVGLFQVPTTSHVVHEIEAESRGSPAQQFYSQGQQLHPLYPSSTSHAEGFYQVYAQQPMPHPSHAPLTMVYNQSQKYPVATQSDSGYSPTYAPMQHHSQPIVEHSRFVAQGPQGHGLPPMGGPTPHYVDNTQSQASSQSTQLYYHAESGSYVVRHPSQLQPQLTRPASYPSLSTHSHIPQVQQQQTYYAPPNPIQTSKHATTPTYPMHATSYPTQQAAQHHAAPSLGGHHAMHTLVQSAGISPTMLHHPGYHASGFTSPAYQHPTVQVGAAVQGSNSTHAAFFNNNNEAIRQSYQAQSGPSPYTGEQFLPQALVHDSRRTSGSSLREEYGTASSGGSSPLPSHAVPLEVFPAPTMRGPPPVIPKSIDDDGDEDGVLSNAFARGRSGKMMMAPTPLS